MASTSTGAPVSPPHAIGGNKKMIVYDDPSRAKVKVYDKGIGERRGRRQRGRNGQKYGMLVGYRTGDVWAPQIDGAEALGVETRHLIECINQNKTPIADGHAGLRVVRMLAAATQSMRENGRIVELASSEVSA